MEEYCYIDAFHPSAVFIGEKPNYEIGSAAKLSLGGGNKAKVAAVWKLDVDDDEDERIDADELLDEEDKIKPSAESLRGSISGTTRAAIFMHE